MSLACSLSAINSDRRGQVFDIIPANIPLNLIEKENIPSFYEEVLHQQDSHNQNEYLQKQQNRKDRALKLRTHFQQMEIKDYMKNFLKKQIQFASKKAKVNNKIYNNSGTKISYIFKL